MWGAFARYPSQNSCHSSLQCARHQLALSLCLKGMKGSPSAAACLVRVTEKVYYGDSWSPLGVHTYDIVMPTL